MERRGKIFVAVGIVLAVAIGVGSRFRSSFMRKPPPVQTVKPPLTASVTHLPLAFERNEGQFDPRVLYAAHTSDGTLFFTNDGLTLALPRFAPEPSRFPDPRARPRKHPALQSVAALRLAFAGANPTPRVEATDQQPGIKNYLIGRDPEKWHTHVPIFGKVAYRDLYPGIDLVFYGGKSGLLEYDLNVSPGADSDQVRFRFEGADRIELDDGDLLIQAGLAELHQARPHVYTATVPRREVPVSYRIDSQGRIGLDISKREVRDGLRIDPVLAYSTYLGGSGAGDVTQSMTVDLAGSVYVTGFVTSVDFPTTDGGLQAHDPQSGPPMPNIGISTVTKLNPGGSALVYSTYIGGALPAGAIGDSAGGLVVTDAGFAYVAGQTGSPDFPVTPDAGQTAIGGTQDGYVLELAPEGDRLIYSTFLGGPDLEILTSVDVDPEGNAWVCGADVNGSHFPITSNALQPEVLGDAGAGIIAKLSPDGTQFLYKSYFGGNGGGYADQITNVKVDAQGRPLFLGYTGSGDVPGHATSPRPFNEGGGGDAYLTRLSSDGSSQVLFTFLGGSGLDFGWDLRLDSLGNAWVAGQTGSADFPVSRDAIEKSLSSSPTNDPNGPFDAFIAVISQAGALQYATYLGGNGDDRAWGIAVDAQGHAHVMGFTSSTDLTTIDALHGEHDETLPEYQHDGGDFFLADFTIDGGLDFLSYLGGSGSEFSFPATGVIAVDSLGATYFVGTSASDDFPVTAHAFQKKNNALADVANMVVVKLMPTPPPCTLLSIKPNFGPAIGVLTTAHGTNIGAQSELDFGGVPSTIVGTGPSQISATAPPHACGAVDVTLICPGSPPSTLPDGFTYVGCPDSGSEVPDAGPSTDGGAGPSSSGCSFGSRGTSLAALWALGLSLLAIARRGRQRRNP